MKIKRRYWVLTTILVVVVVVPAYVRLCRVPTASDAPNYLVGDHVLVNKAAFDVKVPYTGIVIFSHADPEPGEMVMFQEPDADYLVFKRVIGCPGDTVAMRDNHLSINGRPLDYVPFNGVLKRADENGIGTVVEIEKGSGIPHPIAYDPGSSAFGTFGPVDVPEGRYFVLGDNRDNSKDSRMYGAIPREAIVGRVGRPFRRE